MNVRNELEIWKKRLGKKDDLVEPVSFFWIYEYLLPLLESLLKRIEQLETSIETLTEIHVEDADAHFWHGH